MSYIYKYHNQKSNKQETKKKIEDILVLVNLPKQVFHMYPHELSGGMMQRVSIALSLMFNPKLIILDEATTALDVVTQTQVLDEIMELERKLGLTRIMITHDISVVAATCKNIAVLYAGRLLEAGPVDEVLVNPMHSYTKGLINSFPVCSEEYQPLNSIGGFLPDLSDPPEGCIFNPRCKNGLEICRKEIPMIRRIGRKRLSACHFHGGDGYDTE